VRQPLFLHPRTKTAPAGHFFVGLVVFGIQPRRAIPTGEPPRIGIIKLNDLINKKDF
jgi:hypothetical protein